MDKMKSGKKGQETREMILNAAKAVFSMHPYNAASIRMIANQGGFYHGLIRYHFSSKAAIFDAVAKELCQGLRKANKMWLHEVRGLSPQEGMPLYLDRFISYYESNQEAFRIIALNLTQQDAHCIPGYRRLTDLLSGSRADAEEAEALPFDKESATRFLESLNALLVHFLGSGPAEARLLGFEPDSPAYFKWVKETMMFIFLPVLEKSLNGGQ